MTLTACTNYGPVNNINPVPRDTCFTLAYNAKHENNALILACSFNYIRGALPNGISLYRQNI